MKVEKDYEDILRLFNVSIPKINFKEIWRNKKISKYGDEKIFFIGQKDLIKIKKISGREQDRVDLKILTHKG